MEIFLPVTGGIDGVEVKVIWGVSPTEVEEVQEELSYCIGATSRYIIAFGSPPSVVVAKERFSALSPVTLKIGRGWIQNFVPPSTWKNFDSQLTECLKHTQNYETDRSIAPIIKSPLNGP